MVFLVRQYLKMKPGKIAAQVAHATLRLYDNIIFVKDKYQQEALDFWVNYGQKRIVLKISDLKTMDNALKQWAKISNC